MLNVHNRARVVSSAFGSCDVHGGLRAPLRALLGADGAGVDHSDVSAGGNMRLLVMGVGCGGIVVADQTLALQGVPCCALSLFYP